MPTKVLFDWNSTNKNFNSNLIDLTIYLICWIGIQKCLIVFGQFLVILIVVKGSGLVSCQQAHTPKLQCSWLWVGWLCPVTTRRANRVILDKINKSDFLENHPISLVLLFYLFNSVNHASVKFKWAKLVDLWRGGGSAGTAVVCQLREKNQVIFDRFCDLKMIPAP